MSNRIFIFFVVLSILLVFCLAVNAGDTVSRNTAESKKSKMSSLSSLDLVLLLQYEYETADMSATGESNTNYFYDIVVEELLSRRDIESIPLLLLRSNDNTTVTEREEGKAWISKSKYGTPVLVKYKVRFILFRLLDSEDYRQLVGFSSVNEIDLEKSIQYYINNKEGIKGRLKKLQTLEEIQKEQYQKLKAEEKQ